MPTTICVDCGQLTPRSPCSACRSRRNRNRDRRRGLPAQRGYGYAWQQVSAQVRAEEPQCYLCGAPSTATDHVIPKARGGTDHRSNLQGICGPCNSAKRDR